LGSNESKVLKYNNNSKGYRVTKYILSKGAR